VTINNFGGTLNLATSLHRTCCVNAVYVRPTQASLGWLYMWGPLQGPPVEYVRMRVYTTGPAPGEPGAATPETWRRLRDLLSPTAALLCIRPEVMRWVEGCSSRLTRLELEPPRDPTSINTAVTSLQSLANLRELCLPPEDDEDTSLALADCSPLSILSGLTALTLGVHKWDEPCGPLPPALQNLEIQLLPPLVFFGFDENTQDGRSVALDLTCRGLRDSLGPAAASLQRLTVTYQTFDASYNGNDEQVDCICHVNLTQDSIPCAFSGLKEFKFAVYEVDRRDPHTADLVALLEAAPGLRRVQLDDIPNLSGTTTAWLLRERPGSQMHVDTQQGDTTTIVLEVAEQF
jgi:hypothetical protein